MSIVKNVIYTNGQPVAEPASLAKTFELLRERANQAQDMAWIGLVNPNGTELTILASEFQLHKLAIEDAVHAHQRPKMERYGKTLFVVLRPAHYVDAWEEIIFSEVHIFLGENFAVTVRHGDRLELGRVRQRLEAKSDLLSRGPEAVLYAILDQVVDDYAPVLDGLQNDIDEIETEVFAGDAYVSKRIYRLSRHAIELQRATTPLINIFKALRSGFSKYRVDSELQRHLRDVEDHTIRIVERIDGFRQLLQNILTVNASLVGQRQNEEMRNLTETSLRQNEEVKKISAWAAILFAPTLVGTIYGMNFDDMPETHWPLGYPFSLVLMAAISLSLYIIFRKRKWL